MLKTKLGIIIAAFLIAAPAMATELEIDAPELDFDKEIAKQDAITADIADHINETPEQRIARHITNSNNNSSLKVQLIPVKR